MGESLREHWQSLTPKAKADLVRPLWDADITCTEIAARLGITKSSVLGIAHRHHMTIRDNPVGRRSTSAWATPERVARAKEMAAANYWWADIYRALREMPGPDMFARKTTSKWFNDHGIYLPERKKVSREYKPAKERRVPGVVTAPVMPGRMPERRPAVMGKPVFGVPCCLWTGGERGSYWYCDAPCEELPGTDKYKPFCEFHAIYGYKQKDEEL